MSNALEWPIAQARRAIHVDDVEGLKQLLAGYPALLSWRGAQDDGGLLGMATGAYGDAGDPKENDGSRARRRLKSSSTPARSLRHMYVTASLNPAPEGCSSCFTAKACCRVP